MAQDFWASSGFRDLRVQGDRLCATDAWLARFLQGEELLPPPDAGPREREVHAALFTDIRRTLSSQALAAVEDPDARDNWRAFLDFRDHVGAHPSLEEAYLALFAREVTLAPVFVDALARVVLRGALDGTEDAGLCRAGELFFRRQRVSNEDGRILAADAITVEAFAETGGFGDVGRFLKRQGTALPTVKMDVLSAENAAFYFLRDELHSFALDLTPGREGAHALARVLEAWVRRLLRVEARIEPMERIDDERWRWHVGLDAEATAILDALYRGTVLPEEDAGRIVSLFRLEFRDARDAVGELGGRPVYLALACRPDRTLRMKPQNLLVNLPLAVK